MHRLVDDLQEPGFADAQERCLGRSYETVLRIVVDEDFLAVAGLVGERDVAVGKQHFVVLFVFEVKPVVGDAADGEGVGAACFEHGGVGLPAKVRFISLRRNFPANSLRRKVGGWGKIITFG